MPLAFLILYSTLLLLLLHWLPLISTAIGWCVSLLAQLLNIWVQLTETLPFSKLVASITTPETILLYLILITLLLLIRLRSLGWGIAACIVLLTLAVSGMVRLYEQRTQTSFTIYHIQGHTLLHFVKGHQEYLKPVGQSPDSNQLGYHVAPARLQAGFTMRAQPDALPQDFALPHGKHNTLELISWQGLRIAIIDGAPALRTLPPTPIEVDVLLLRKNPKLDLSLLMQKFNFKKLILDGSNAYWYRQSMGSEANSLDLPVHITAVHGAYHLQL